MASVGTPSKKSVLFYLHFDGQPVTPAQLCLAGP
jgi:hypothetical protein